MWILKGVDVHEHQCRNLPYIVVEGSVEKEYVVICGITLWRL